MLAGIRDILVITNPWETSIFQNLLGNADIELGINIEFATQISPNGLPEAFTIAKKHYGDRLSEYDQVVLILGDNIFYGAGLSEMLIKAALQANKASVFLQRVADPTRFGVAEFDPSFNIIGMEEKPSNPKSNYAITGMYFFPTSVFGIAETLKPSARGELEILGLLDLYLRAKALNGNVMLRGMSWFDTGTPDSLLEAANFIKAIQDHQGFLVGSPHEVAFNHDWITEVNVTNYLRNWGKKTPYGRYLLDMIKDT